MNANTKKTVENNEVENAHVVSCNEARRERWQRHVVAAVEAVKGFGYVPGVWFEEVEKRPICDIVLDRVCQRRGVGVSSPTYSQRVCMMADDEIEKAGARKLEESDRKMIDREVRLFLAAPAVVDMLDCRSLVARFYRPGDNGLNEAVGRAVKAAIAS